ncbi:MAG: hypothetical protein Q8P59_05135, partial [Dehalococcoidia bacterium]|nr:hypothetical protein [Dehalococcoidia bacterium]
QQAPLVSVGSQGKRFPTLSFGETIPSLTEVDERMRALTGQTGPVSEPVAQAIEAGYRPLQSQPPQGQIAAENGRFYDPATGVWEPWEQFQARMAENEQSRQVAVQSQQQAQVQVPTGAPSTTQATQTTQMRPPQINAVAGGNVVKQGAAFGGTAQAGGGFFPIPQGSVLQERFTREFNEAQQQRFRRRGVPQVRFR